jgi:hypothetical protein
MARHNLKQSEGKSCAAACIAVALEELGITGFASDTATEKKVYPAVQRGPGRESSPALCEKYLNEQPGVRAWVMESPLRTGALMAGSRGKLLKPWLEYSAELWSNWRWRYLRGLVESDFDNDARVLLGSIIAAGTSAGLMHFILARKDAGHYWVMNPDGGKDEQHDDLFAKYLNTFDPETFGGVPYVYTGVCVWMCPSSASYKL